MSDFSVPIVKITNVHPITGADRIELATVLGYQSIIRKGQFSPGDLAVYIPEQALVPDSLLESIGLKGKLAGSQANRVKAVRLRGKLSQGILISIPPELADKKEGDNVQSELGIVKWEPPIPIHLAGEVTHLGGKTLKYDIENIKRYPEVLQEGEEVVLCEKVHGTHVQIGILPVLETKHPELLDGHIFLISKGLGAKGLVFKWNDVNQKNVYFRAFNSLTDENRRTLAQRIAHAPASSVKACPFDFIDYVTPLYLFGEVYGIGVQDMGYGKTQPSLRFFDVYVGQPGIGRYLSVDEKISFFNFFGMEMVDILYRGPFSREVIDEHCTGNTVTGNGMHIREGVVITPVKERRDDNLGRVILKHINPDYLLRKGKVTEYN
jgi:RNA ligase (TIGR02306 family)